MGEESRNPRAIVLRSQPLPPRTVVIFGIRTLDDNRTMPEMFSGLGVPGWWKSETGLILPSSVRDLHVESAPDGSQVRFEGLLTAERRKPLGNVGVYATPSAMHVESLPIEEFISNLSEVPLGMMLSVVGWMQAAIHGKEMDRQVHLGIAGGLFNRTPAFPLIAHFLETHPGEAVAFCEQGLTLLQILALRHCAAGPTGLSNDQYLARIRRTIFFVTDYLEPHGASAEDRASWLGHLTRLFEYNGHAVFGNAMGRAWTIFGRLHRDTSSNQSDLPLDDWLLEDYGLDLEQQLTLGFALFAHLGAESEDPDEFAFEMTVEALGGIFSSMKLSEEQREAAEALIAAPPSWFRSEVEGQSIEQLSWNRVPFMQRPFIRLPTGNYSLQSPRALMAWTAEGVHYRCLDSAKRRELVGPYTSRVGKLTERYVLEMISHAHREPRLPGAGKVHGDKKFANGIDSSDVTVTYPHEALLIEVASRRLTVETRRDGNQRSLERDLTEMVGRRPKQLRRSIDAMKPTLRGRVATLRFEHLEPERIARFWPMIVTMTPLHWSPLLEDFLAPGTAELEGRDDVEALDVLAIEDLEALVAITEQTGSTLTYLLSAKQEAAGIHADVRTWLSRDQRFPNLARPSYLDAALSEALDLVARLLGHEDIRDDTAA